MRLPKTNLKRPGDVRRPITRSAILNGAPNFYSAEQPNLYELVQGSAASRWTQQEIPIDFVPPPDDVLRVVENIIQTKGRVVIVSHKIPSPDGDAVGGTVGLVRALRALGVDASGCIDVQQLKGDLRGFVRSGELISVDAQKKLPAPDLVIMSDVAQPDMVGGAADLLKEAKNVMVLDHHDVDPSASSLGLNEAQGYTDWIDPSAESASGIGLSLVGALTKSRRLPDDVMADVTEPLLLGMLTDMEFGQSHQVSLLPLLQAKHVLERFHDGNLAKFEQKLRSELPESCRKALLGHALPASVRAAVDVCDVEGVTHKVCGVQAHIKAVPKSVLAYALSEAKNADPRAMDEDLLKPLMEALNDEVFSRGSKTSISALLLELPDGQIQISIRTRAPELAPLVAGILEGGGKAHAAGARFTLPLKEAKNAVIDAIREGLKTSLRVRSF